MRVLVSIALAAALFGGDRTSSQPRLEVRERRLARLPVDARLWNGASADVVVDPTQRHFAYIVRSGGRQYLVIDGQVQPPHDEILRFAGYNAPNEPPIRFSPDGRRVAYQAKDGKSISTFVDGELPPHKLLQLPKFASNGRMAIMYLPSERTENDDPPVIFSVEGMRPFACDEPLYDLFSPEGGRYAVWTYDRIGDDLKTFIALDGQRIPVAGDGEGEMAFSPSGRLFGYVEEERHRCTVVINNRRISVPAMLDDNHYLGMRGPDRLVIADNGSYAVRVFDPKETSESAICVYHNRRLGKRYPEIMDMHLSRDGRHLTYWTSDDDQKGRVVKDEVAGPEYQRVLDPVVTSDGSHVAYMARKSESQAVVVIDGVEQPAHESVKALEMSRDGRSFAYFALDGGKQTLVTSIDGVVSETSLPGAATRYAWSAALKLSPNGKHVAWATQGQLGIDKLMGPRFDGLPAGSGLVWDSNSHARTIAIRGGELLSIDLTVHR